LDKLIAVATSFAVTKPIERKYYEGVKIGKRDSGQFVLKHKSVVPG